MQTLEEVKDENLLTKKRNQKVRVRGLLIGVNALLVAYCGYLTVSSIVSAVNKNSSNGNNVVTVLNKNEADTISFLEKYISAKEDVLDIATYGRYLLTSGSHVSPALVNNVNKVELINLTELENNGHTNRVNTFTLGTKLDEQIDLFNLSSGDYIIVDGTYSTDYKVLHYTGEEYYQDTIYSFPTQDGLRKKITIKAKASCPGIVINVSEQEASLPEDYYDIVILNTTGDSKSELFKNTNLKIIEVNTLKEAYKIKASYAINVVEGDSLLTSNYVNTTYDKSSLISGGILDSLDEDNAIRELGGYVFNAGYGLGGTSSISKASQDIKNVLSKTHVGKFTLTVGKDYESIYETVKSIFQF